MPQIDFNLHYRTIEEETLYCSFETSEQVVGKLAMHSINGEDWTARLSLPKDTHTLYYSYELQGKSDVLLRSEEGVKRSIDLKNKEQILCIDNWFNKTLESAFAHSSFAKATMPPYKQEILANELLQIRLYAPPPPIGYVWALVGESKELGAWQTEQAIELKYLDICCWGINLKSTIQVGEYKYILRSKENPSLVIWEIGNNRFLDMPNYSFSRHVLRMDCAPDMGDVHWRIAGVVIPIFSLRSEGSQGIGDFGDLCKMIDWATNVGMRAIQLLPINDTSATGTSTDSYPYNSISVFALHPLYIDAREWCETSAFIHYQKSFEALNVEETLNYEKVYYTKMSFLHELFKGKGEVILGSDSYRAFIRQNEDWLPAYALFCTLRDKYGTANFRKWKQLSNYDTYIVKDYLEQHKEDLPLIDFYCFVQYLVFTQMKRAHKYARELGIILKGDLPIGVNRNSVDAWVYPSLFHFNGQAGAPPDDFAIKGQNWGFPTYNWEEMARTKFAWWHRRLEVMKSSFDAYRIDHVLGFFRIWEIPIEQIEGVLGYFRPAKPYTQEELRNWGFTLLPSEYTHPCLSHERFLELEQRIGYNLDQFFFERAGHYYLKSEFDTQNKIIRRITDETLQSLLCDVCTEVLFISDPQNPNMYHPRIAGQQTLRYKQLTTELQIAFTRLHDYFFYTRHNDMWAKEATRKLVTITSSENTKQRTKSMLPCAEDLGMVPASVKGVLEALHILSLEIQRMPKEYGIKFSDPSLYPYYSVATIATHDMSPLRLWWKRLSEEERENFWFKVLHKKEVPPIDASPDLCTSIVSQHLASHSMFCLLAWQDWMSISKELRSSSIEKEQINDPSNPNHYWGYRMHLTIERLLEAEKFNQQVHLLITRHGR